MGLSLLGMWISMKYWGEDFFVADNDAWQTYRIFLTNQSLHKQKFSWFIFLKYPKEVQKN